MRGYFLAALTSIQQLLIALQAKIIENRWKSYAAAVLNQLCWGELARAEGIEEEAATWMVNLGQHIPGSIW